MLLNFAMTGLLFWLAAFALFVLRMEASPASEEEKSDALIVLTGGKARVERGFELLSQGAAPVLLVSGVGHKVTIPEMLSQHASAQTKAQIEKRHAMIVFDYDASTTQTNAENTAEFVRSHQYHTIRLVTAHYHMPRSLIEFRAALPDVTILPEPVVPEEFAANPWWETRYTRGLVLQEFHKYLAAYLRLRLQENTNAEPAAAP